MIYAIILAGGVGNRFQDDLPKQFHMLKDKPVFIHTIENFINYPEEIKIVLTINENYIEYTKKILKKFLDIDIHITKGGKTRTESLINACNFIVENFETTDDDIIITHDAARPFINNRIIKENIEKLNNADGVSTAIETYNSILEVDENGNNIVNVPIRKNMRLVQTPQTFKLNEYLNNYNSLTQEEIDSLIEASKSYVIKGKKVSIVRGELYNIKITTKYDLDIAKTILEKKLNY